ncbi:hypothetical protein WR25_26949 isoform H [Diploscapter pachys]|nr:hypothetical protein WR25_26949 isoform H [Diploscapter pachys]
MTDEFLEVQRPRMPNFVHIGSLGLEDENDSGKLDKNTAKEMEKGEDGIVYFSLGTTMNSSMLQPFVMRTVLGAAKKFPDYHFIIKIDAHDQTAKEFSKGVDNVFVTDWVAQRALLKHPRLRAFITHSGYNGIVESAMCGVPLVTIPFMFDQIRNSLAVEQGGWGVGLTKEALRDDPKMLQTALNEVLSNDRYKKMAMRMKNLLKTKPFKAKERLVKYTEFVLSNGGMKELIAPSRHLSIIKLYNLDVYLFLITTIFVFIYIPLKLTSVALFKTNRKKHKTR